MTHWAFPCYVTDWPEIISALSKAEPRLRAIGRPNAADQLLHAYAELRDELDALNTTSATYGTLVLKRMEKTSRVRPDAGAHGSIYGNLNDALFVKKLPDIPGIGIVDLDVLDADVPWWETNEFGSSANVGRLLYGTFYGAADAGPPDASQFREHPLFEPGKNGSLSGGGIIENPIPARHFITRAIEVIDPQWRQEFLKIKARYMQRLDLVGRTLD